MKSVAHNPLIETLVHPASKVVEVAKPSLVGKLAPKRQRLERHREDNPLNFHSKLPPEIWLIIFDIVLAPVLHTHELANSETITSITRLMLRCGTHMLPYDDWPRLRLVCRMFHDLLGPNRYQGIQGPNDDKVLPIGVEALSMGILDTSMNPFAALQDPTALSRIRIFDITLVVITDGSGTIQSIMDDLHILAPNLPSLRSLSLYSSGKGVHTLRDDAWQRIANDFPLLEDLCLWADQPIQPCKPATLKNVKTLRTCDMPASNVVQFPSLIHICTFRWNSDGAFETLHAHKLASLDACHPRIGIDRRILHLLPNVRHLGASIYSLAGLETPSSGHPINHISVVIEGGATVEANLKREMPRLVRKLKQMPGVTKLSFGSGGLPPTTMEYILESLRETNVSSIFTEV